MLSEDDIFQCVIKCTIGGDLHQRRFSRAIEAAVLAKVQPDIDFYQCRVELLQKWQSKMRDPERTIACDIIANGQTIEDIDPQRYAAPVQQEPVACKKLCELCEKRGYDFCANAAKIAPLPSAPVKQEPANPFAVFQIIQERNEARDMIRKVEELNAELEEQNKQLLEALKGCVKVMEPHMERDGYLVIRVGLARAAIAAVEGKQ